MSQTCNPMLENPFSKYMDLSKMMGDLKLPAMNFEPMLSAQRKNIEAINAVSQAMFEGYQAIAHRQADLMRQCMEDCSGMVNAVMACPTPEEKVIKQAEVSKAAVDKCLANVRDISEAISKCNYQAMETVSCRLNEGLSELRGMIKKSGEAA